MSPALANVSLQLTSAKNCGSIAVSAYRVASARKLTSRILGRPLAAELWRYARYLTLAHEKADRYVILY